MVTTNQVEQLRKFYDAFIIEPSGYIELKEDQKETYQSFVRALHDDELPNNWRYTIITDLLQNFVNEYEQDRIEDCLSEIVDSLVDVYNIDLIEWLKGDIMRGSFLEIKELNINQPNMTIFDLIRQMQYEVIYSIGSRILDHQYQTFEEFHEQRIKEDIEREGDLNKLYEGL